jgi:hypothetical protein
MEKAANTDQEYYLRHLVSHLIEADRGLEVRNLISPRWIQIKRSTLGSHLSTYEDIEKAKRLAFGLQENGLAWLFELLLCQADIKLEQQILPPANCALRTALEGGSEVLKSLTMVNSPLTQAIAYVHIGCMLRKVDFEMGDRLITDGIFRFLGLEEPFSIAFGCQELSFLHQYYGCFQRTHILSLAGKIKYAIKLDRKLRIGPDVRWYLGNAVQVILETSKARNYPKLTTWSWRWQDADYQFHKTLSTIRMLEPGEINLFSRLFKQAAEFIQESLILRCGMSRDGYHFDPESKQERLALETRDLAKEMVAKLPEVLGEEADLLSILYMVKYLLYVLPTFPHQQKLEIQQSIIEVCNKVAWLGLAAYDQKRNSAKRTLEISNQIAEMVERQVQASVEVQRLELVAELLKSYSKVDREQGNEILLSQGLRTVSQRAESIRERIFKVSQGDFTMRTHLHGKNFRFYDALPQLTGSSVNPSPISSNGVRSDAEDMQIHYLLAKSFELSVEDLYRYIQNILPMLVPYFDEESINRVMKRVLAEEKSMEDVEPLKIGRFSIANEARCLKDAIYTSSPPGNPEKQLEELFNWFDVYDSQNLL